MFLILGPILMNKLSVGRHISYSYMRAAFTSQSVPVQTMLCQLWRCWPSIETTLGEFPVSAHVLALMPATAPMFPTLGS